MTHAQRIIDVVSIKGFIIPAKVANKYICGHHIPFNVDRRCRELKEQGLLKADWEDGMRKWLPTKKFRNKM